MTSCTGRFPVVALEIELLTIKIRFLIASVDKACEIGMDWWELDPSLSCGQHDLAEENRDRRERVGALESRSAGRTHRRVGISRRRSRRESAPRRPGHPHRLSPADRLPRRASTAAVRGYAIPVVGRDDAPEDEQRSLEMRRRRRLSRVDSKMT
jgi:hypothetical protein